MQIACMKNAHYERQSLRMRWGFLECAGAWAAVVRMRGRYKASELRRTAGAARRLCVGAVAELVQVLGELVFVERLARGHVEGRSDDGRHSRHDRGNEAGI